MSKNYEDYKPINPMPPRKRKNPMLSFVQVAIIALLIIALTMSAVLFLVSHSGEKGDNRPETLPSIETESPNKEPEQTDEVTTGGEQGSDEPTVPTIDKSAYKEYAVAKTEINKGSLILVSSNYKVVYPTNADLVNLFNNKTASYKASINTMLIHKDVMPSLNKMMDDFLAASGKNDVIIWTSYRDEARQTTVYNEYVAQYGEAAAKTAVAKPGESDHHTGLGVALRVYDAAGLTHKISDIEGYSWIQENCYKYGYVERYPSDKISVTGLDYSSSVYLRYVGVPHAEIMKKNNWCLEEYLIKIKDYTFGNAHYEFTSEDGSVYEVYYESGEGAGDTVNVHVPAGKEYTISGNNMDGFVIAVKK